jgi:hypothetical protein
VNALFVGILSAGQHDAYRAHPWLLRLPPSRTVRGPHVLDRHEATLALLHGHGLPPVDLLACVAALDSHTRGAAAAVVEAEQAPARTGDDPWERLLTERMDGRYPLLAALEQPGAPDPLERFTFGLDLVLDSVAARIGRHRI